MAQQDDCDAASSIRHKSHNDLELTMNHDSDQPKDTINVNVSGDTGQQARVYEDTMLKLMQQQTELLYRLLEQSNKTKDSESEPVAPAPKDEHSHSKEILDVLSKINDRQAASGEALSLEIACSYVLKAMHTDMSKQPIPPAPATSAAAWSPLLRSHLAHIQPEVDRWRGVLDTLLVFVRRVMSSTTIRADRIFA